MKLLKDKTEKCEIMKQRLNEKRFVKDGKLYAFFQKRKGGKVYYTYSEDNEKTWSTPKVVKASKGIRGN